MRFLLYAKPRTSSVVSSVARRERARPDVVSAVAHRDGATTTATATTTTTTTRAWGQRCSENDCGCVVRFETEIDPRTDVVVDCVVRTRALVRDAVSNEPARTPRSGRPVLRACRCDTLNALGARVADWTVGKSWSADVRSATEFAGTRSSAAFRHVVLRTLDDDEEEERRRRRRTRFPFSTPATEPHRDETRDPTMRRERCYDLVEEAFTAMVRGHMPAPRRTHRQIDGHAHVSRSLGVPERTTAPSTPALSPRYGDESFEDVVLGNFLDSGWRNDINFYKGGDTDSVFSAALRGEKRASINDGEEDDKMEDWLSYIDYQERQRDEPA